MAFVTRPNKTGGNTTYADEVAGGNTTIKSTEVDGDILAITSQIDGNIEAVNLASDAVETAKIKDANVTAAKMANNSVETAHITDLNVTAGKMAASAIFRELQEVPVGLGLSITTVETNIAVLPGITVIASGYAIIFGQWALSLETGAVVLPSQYADITLYRGATPLTQSIRRVETETGTAGLIKPIPTQIYFDLPGAGTHIYTWKAVTSSAQVTVTSPAANAGRVWVVTI
ncbi:MAG: hypothetical protein ACXADF_16370 [Candidatus Thorarchaeota archaeon]|jgi:hypothetical protein